MNSESRYQGSVLACDPLQNIPRGERIPSRTIRILSQRQAWILLAGDSGLILIALYASALIRFGVLVPMLQEYTGASIGYLFTFLSSFYLLELYEVDGLRSGRATLFRLCGAATLAIAGLSAFFFWSTSYRYGRGIFLLAAFLTVLMAYGWRRMNVRLVAAMASSLPTMLVGNASCLARVRTLIEGNSSKHRIVGEFHTHPSHHSSAIPGLQGGLDSADLEQIVNLEGIRCLVVSSDIADLGLEQAAQLTRMKFKGVVVAEAGHFCARISGLIPLELLHDSWLWFADGFDLIQARLARRIKRLSDLFLATVGLVLSSPLTILTAVAIKLDSPGPVFYRQERVGLQENVFELLKFRSMRVDAESDGAAQWAGRDDARVTRVGRWLRKFRIDEIPQMINVLKGDMSFIGPRPERPEFVAQLRSAISFYHLRHYVRPGITGWAQVNYPYGASIEDGKRKLEYDLYYIMNASVALDLRILLRTIRVILLLKGSR